MKIIKFIFCLMLLSFVVDISFAYDDIASSSDADFDLEYNDISSQVPFESNSPDDLDLPFKEYSIVQEDVFDFIGFENDFKMLSVVNSLDLSIVENKETAIMLKFVGYELFVVRVTLSILTIALITGFFWKNFEKMFDKIKKGRSNL